MSGVSQQSRRERRIASASDGEQAAVRQWITVWFERAPVFGALQFHKISGSEIEVIPVEELAHSVDQEIVPPGELLAGQSTCLDLDQRRGGCFPIAERLDETQLKYRTL